MSDLIVPVSRMKGTSLEAQYTEEVLRLIEEANVKLRRENVESVALGSIDVKALYPSLRIKAAAKVEVAARVVEAVAVVEIAAVVEVAAIVVEIAEKVEVAAVATVG